MKRLRSGRLVSYGIVVVSVAAATLGRLSLDGILDERAPLLLYTLAVMIAAWFGGLRAGLLATVLSLVTGSALFLNWTGILRPAESADAVRLVLFALSGAGISVLSGRLHGERENTAKALLREQRARLETQEVLESISEGFSAFDRNWRYTYVNAEVERLNGLSREEHLGKVMWELFPSTVGTRFEEQLRRSMSRGEPAEFIEYSQLKDQWFLIKAYPAKEGGLSLFHRDITEQKRAEQILQESESRFHFLSDLGERTRTLTDVQAVTVSVAQQLGEFLSVSRCAYADVEADSDQFTIRGDYTSGCSSTAGQHLLSSFGPRGTADMRSGRTLVIRNVECELALGEGREMFEAIAVRAIICCPLVKDGSLTAMMAVHQTAPRNWTEGEISLVEQVVERSWAYIEKARVEQALRLSEAWLRQMADAMPQIVWSSRPDGSLDWYNERWYEFTGFERSLKGDQSWTPVLHPDDVRRSQDVWNDCVRTGEPYQIEYRFLDRKAGRFRWHLGRALPVRDEAGQIVRWFGTCTDIDDQKATEDKLRRSNEDLQQFAFAAAHDLQEPLRTVTSYTQLVSRSFEGALSDKQRQFMTYVVDASKHMGELIRDLREFLEVNDRSGDDFRQVVSLDNALKKAIESLETAIGESAALVTSERLPSVLATEVHFVQVFQNLIGNAIKYRRAEEPSRVHVSAERQGSEWLISVADNGIGIAPRYREQIFGLFKRLHGKSVAGTGIGLAICQKVVERYGGRIWVNSDVGRGATFMFTVPVVEAAEDSEESAASVMLD